MVDEGEMALLRMKLEPSSGYKYVEGFSCKSVIWVAPPQWLVMDGQGFLDATAGCWTEAKMVLARFLHMLLDSYTYHSWDYREFYMAAAWVKPRKVHAFGLRMNSFSF